MVNRHDRLLARAMDGPPKGEVLKKPSPLSNLPKFTFGRLTEEKAMEGFFRQAPDNRLARRSFRPPPGGRKDHLSFTGRPVNLRRP